MVAFASIPVGTSGQHISKVVTHLRPRKAMGMSRLNTMHDLP